MVFEICYHLKQCFLTGVRKLCLWCPRVDSTLLFFMCIAAPFKLFSSHFLLPHLSKKHYEKTIPSIYILVSVFCLIKMYEIILGWGGLQYQKG
jgi:hypothetical protein